MNTTSNKLFVYGSLRKGFKNPAYDYLTSYFSYTAEAITKGEFYESNNLPVAVPTTNDNYIVGEIYTLNHTEEFSWAFEQLDDYEGLNVLPGETPLYVRTLVDVIVNNEVVKAWAYWYNKSIDGFTKINSNDLLKYLSEKNSL
jgi:gamma-glutamylcyclotransferase (GGCT)/AIG2-like uncharacterized protein YtfP